MCPSQQPGCYDKRLPLRAFAFGLCTSCSQGKSDPDKGALSSCCSGRCISLEEQEGGTVTDLGGLCLAAPKYGWLQVIADTLEKSQLLNFLF